MNGKWGFALAGLLLLTGCGQGRPSFTPADHPFATGALPEVASLAAAGSPARVTAIASYELLDAAPVMSCGGPGAVYSSHELELAPASAPNGLAWAVFSLGGFHPSGVIAPRELAYTTDAPGWLAVADYELDSWRLYEAAGGAAVELADGTALVSPEGAVYVAMLSCDQDLLCLSLSLILSNGLEPVEPDGSWKQYRCNAQRNACSSASGPETPELKWSTYLDQSAASPPVLSPDEQVVYVGSRDDRLVALSTATLEPIWHYVAYSDVLARPAVDASGRIYCGTYAGTVYCLPADGSAAVWAYDAGGTLHSNLVLAAGKLYLASREGIVHCVDLEGDGVWTYDAGSYIDYAPAVDSMGNVYVAVADSRFTALDPDGNWRWDYYHEGSNCVYTPAIGADDSVYFAEGYSGFGWHESYISKLSAAGTELWSKQFSISDLCPGVTSPILAGAGERIYFCLRDHLENQLVAFDADGTSPWDPVVLQGNFEESLSIAESSTGSIYLICDEQDYVISAAGELLIDSSLPLSSGYDCSALAICVTSAGRVLYTQQSYSLDSGSLVNLDPFSGNYIDFGFEEPERHWEPSAVVFDDAGNAYACIDDLCRVDPSGKLNWRYGADGYPIVSAAVADDRVYAMFADNGLYAIDLSGHHVWSYPMVRGSLPVISPDGTVYCENSTYIGPSPGNLWAFSPEGEVLATQELEWSYRIAPIITPYGFIALPQSGRLSFHYPDLTTANEALTFGRAYYCIALDDGQVLCAHLGNMLGIYGMDGLLYGDFELEHPSWIEPYQPAYGPNESIVTSSEAGFEVGDLYAVFGLQPPNVVNWDYPLHDVEPTAAAIDAEGTSYLCGDDGQLYAIDAQGALKWSLPLCNYLREPAIRPDGSIVILTQYGQLLCVGEAGSD